MFGKKTARCTICHKEINFKYKPKLEWGITGNFCGDCHMKKSYEFYTNNYKPKSKSNILERQYKINIVCGFGLSAISIITGILYNVIPVMIIGVICFAIATYRHNSYRKKISESERLTHYVDVLKERYAKGEITKEEFDKMKTDLV